jgi:predicted NBD/HSP70 family sugar kinase
VGGGLVIDGAPDVGQGLGAGEIGHTWVPDPESGKPDKLEHVASGWSIGKRGSRRLGRELSGAEVAALAEKGDATRSASSRNRPRRSRSASATCSRSFIRSGSSSAAAYR